MNRVIAVVVSLAILACASVSPNRKSSTTINSISLGMSKQEVISVMGEPSRVSADPSAEYLIYSLVEEVDTTYFPPKEIKAEYFIRIVNGVVKAFGRVGEFGSEGLRQR